MNLLTIDDIAALEQPEQEPVAWGVDWGRNGDQSCCTIIKQHADGVHEVVAVEYGPPRPEWRSLSEGALMGLYTDFDRKKDKKWSDVEYLMRFLDVVQAKLKERNA